MATLPQPTPGGARGPVPLPPPALAGAGSSKAPGGGRPQPRVGPPTAPVLCPEAVPPAGGRQWALGAWAECSCGGPVPPAATGPTSQSCGETAAGSAPHPAARARRSPCGEAVWAHSLTPRTAAGTPRPWHALQAGTRPLLAASREGPFPFWGYWGFITLPTRFTGPLSCFEALLVPAAWQALPIPPDGRLPAVPQG